MDIQKRARAVFFDRDGVVVRAIPRKGFKLPTSPRCMEEFEIFPWVSTALEVIKGAGFLRILVTNQPDVKKGFVSYEEWRAMQDKVEELGFDDVFICPHLTEDNCECKKPKPGMLLEAAKKWDIDLARSYMIGDTSADTLAAEAAGCSSILVKGFYNLDVAADYVVDNVIEAVLLIFRLEGGIKMRIFADTANLRDIEEALNRGFIRGITTNPSLLAKEPKADYLAHITQVVELINRYQGFYRDGVHLSVEVFSQNPEVIIEQAHQISDRLKYRHLSIKVQIGWDELEAINRLSDEGFSINCTCCMSVGQAVMAAAAGARYVSLFCGRIRDGGREQKFASQRQDLLAKGVLVRADFNPAAVVGKTYKLLRASYPKVEIIAGSMRSVSDICAAGVAGAHIVTVPPKFFQDMVKHFKTDEVIDQFLTDFQKWMS